jgi:hypothetical protein
MPFQRAARGGVRVTSAAELLRASFERVPVTRARCWTCDARIGFVLLPSGQWRPVELDPNALGEYALHEDRVHAFDLQEARFADLSAVDHIPADYRYSDHRHRCPPSSSRSVTWVIERVLDRLSAMYEGDFERASYLGREDPEKAAARLANIRRAENDFGFDPGELVAAAQSNY